MAMSVLPEDFFPPLFCQVLHLATVDELREYGKKPHISEVFSLRLWFLKIFGFKPMIQIQENLRKDLMLSSKSDSFFCGVHKKRSLHRTSLRFSSCGGLTENHLTSRFGHPRKSDRVQTILLQLRIPNIRILGHGFVGNFMGCSCKFLCPTFGPQNHEK